MAPRQGNSVAERDKQRALVSSIPRTSVISAFLSDEALRLLEVQFGMEDALLAVTVVSVSQAGCLIRTVPVLSGSAPRMLKFRNA